MKKNTDVRIMLKEAGILTVITLLSGLLLGFVYELTKEPIRRQQENAVRQACMTVFPTAEQDQISFTQIKYQPSRELSEALAGKGVLVGNVFEARLPDQAVAGYVVQSITQEGYGGRIVLYVGITTEGKVNDVSILEISETPGLGMQAEKVLLPQFHDKTVETFTYTKTGSQSESQIDAISGATITTRAVTNAVNGALRTARELQGNE